MDDLVPRLKARAGEFGFDLVGICAPEPSRVAAAAYQAWVDAGLAGEMAYMARPDRLAKATSPTATLTTMRSMVVVGQRYPPGDLPPAVRDDPARGLFASYAWGQDYHAVLLPRLADLRDWLAAAAGAPMAGRVWVDTGPVLERDAAERAGLGFVGRNTMLIHPRWGSWLFLGALLTEAELPFDPVRAAGTCGACTRCLVACPTAAFPRPYVLDARRCISYLTIELKGAIPPGLRPGIGNRVFGCDICNAVCPYNRRFAPPPALSEADLTRAAPWLVDLAGLTEAGFQARFGSTPVARTRRRGLLRNVAVALGNWADPAAAAALTNLLGDAEPLVRGHAAWALGRVATPAAGDALRRARVREVDAQAQAEIERALGR
jgi:epoxyqueuosine reductase